MIVLIAVVIVFLTILVSAVLALAVSQLDKAVTAGATKSENQVKSYNPAVTLGYKIPVQGDYDTQMKEARQLAAKQAAATPRGGNMRIGNLREQAGKQPTAWLLYTSPSPRERTRSRMPASAFTKKNSNQAKHHAASQSQTTN